MTCSKWATFSQSRSGTSFFLENFAFFFLFSPKILVVQISPHRNAARRIFPFSRNIPLSSACSLVSFCLKDLVFVWSQRSAEDARPSFLYAGESTFFFFFSFSSQSFLPLCTPPSFSSYGQCFSLVTSNGAALSYRSHMVFRFGLLQNPVPCVYSPLFFIAMVRNSFFLWMMELRFFFFGLRRFPFLSKPFWRFFAQIAAILVLSSSVQLMFAWLSNVG